MKPNRDSDRTSEFKARTTKFKPINATVAITGPKLRLKKNINCISPITFLKTKIATSNQTPNIQTQIMRLQNSEAF